MASTFLYVPFSQSSIFDTLSQEYGVNGQAQIIILHYLYVRNECAIHRPQLKKGDSMPIMTVTWIMILSLVGTLILRNIFENKKMNNTDRKLEVDRRQFSYDAYIPERRLDVDRRHFSYDICIPERRLAVDRRHFSYDTYIPERRVSGDRKLTFNR